jgi:hypothetical protein
MLDSENVSDADASSAQIRLQLIIGLIGIPFLIASTLLWVFVSSYGGYSEYWTISSILYEFADSTGVIGAAFTVVGTIGILQRNRSSLAWVFVAVYIIGWVWRYASGYVVFATVMGIEEIDPILVIIIISSIYGYSMIAASLYAWWSIHAVVSNRPVYFSYLVLYSLGPVVAYLIRGLLFGFGPYAIHYPEESLVFQVPGLIMTTLVYLVLSLFYVSQLYDSR